MGLLLTLVSLVLAFLSPGEIAPSLAPYHLQQIVMVPGLAFSFPSFALRSSKLSSTHSLLMLAFWGAVAMSTLSKLWFGATYRYALDFAPVVFVFFMVHINAFSLGRIKLMAAIISICALIMAFQGTLAYHTGYMADRFVLGGPHPQLRISC